MKKLHTHFRRIPLSAMAIALAILSSAHAQTPPTVTDDVQRDGQILQIFLTLNEGEIMQAEMALDESEDTTLSDIARTIISDHETANDRIEALSAAGMSLEDSELSAALQVESSAATESLGGITGAEFTCRYLALQREQHQHVLTQLLPQLEERAQSAEVKQLVTASAAMLERHLQAAGHPALVTTDCG